MKKSVKKTTKKTTKKVSKKVVKPTKPNPKQTKANNSSEQIKLLTSRLEQAQNKIEELQEENARVSQSADERISSLTASKLEVEKSINALSQKLNQFQADKEIAQAQAAACEKVIISLFSQFVKFKDTISKYRRKKIIKQVIDNIDNVTLVKIQQVFTKIFEKEFPNPQHNELVNEINSKDKDIDEQPESVDEIHGLDSSLTPMIQEQEEIQESMSEEDDFAQTDVQDVPAMEDTNTTTDQLPIEEPSEPEQKKSSQNIDDILNKDW